MTTVSSPAAAPQPIRSGPTGGRNSPTSHAAESAAIRIEFFRDLGTWLAERRPDSPTGRLLDFGCGDLLIARQLDGIWLVDGYDESADARDAARATLTTLDRPGRVYDALADVPTDAYDAVVVNSLFQYVPEAEVDQLFREAAAPLRRNATVGILVTDVVADGANRVIDLRDLLRHLLALLGPIAALRAAVLGIRSGYPSRRQRHREATLAAIARGAGLDLERLPRNLSTFSRRATFVLRWHRP